MCVAEGGTCDVRLEDLDQAVFPGVFFAMLLKDDGEGRAIQKALHMLGNHTCVQQHVICVW